MASVGGNSSTQAFASTLTDLMTSLAVIFILLLVLFLKQAHDQSEKAKETVEKQLEEVLTKKGLALQHDPDDPLKLTVKLDESQLRFPVGSHALSASGAGFIQGFFKNFATQICDPKLKEKVDAVLIEGHTDTSGERTPEGVRNNIALSQKRSFSVLESALKSVQQDSPTYECLLKLTSASGRGSRSPILVNQEYSADQSRRVEIKIRVRSAEQNFKSMAEAAQTATGSTRPQN